MVVAGKNAPDFARIFCFRLSNFKVFQRNTLTVKHAEDVVIGLHKKLNGIGEGFVIRKPRGLRMAVRTNNGQRPYLIIEIPCDLSSGRIGGKQAIWMNQHDSSLALLGLRRVLMKKHRSLAYTSFFAEEFFQIRNMQ
jgi:hypothetical protein